MAFVCHHCDGKIALQIPWVHGASSHLEVQEIPLVAILVGDAALSHSKAPMIW